MTIVQTISKAENNSKNKQDHCQHQIKNILDKNYIINKCRGQSSEVLFQYLNQKIRLNIIIRSRGLDIRKLIEKVK